MDIHEDSDDLSQTDSHSEQDDDCDIKNKNRPKTCSKIDSDSDVENVNRTENHSVLNHCYVTVNVNQSKDYVEKDSNCDIEPNRNEPNRTSASTQSGRDSDCNMKNVNHKKNTILMEKGSNMDIDNVKENTTQSELDRNGGTEQVNKSKTYSENGSDCDVRNVNRTITHNEPDNFENVKQSETYSDIDGNCGSKKLNQNRTCSSMHSECDIKNANRTKTCSDLDNDCDNESPNQNQTHSDDDCDIEIVNLINTHMDPVESRQPKSRNLWDIMSEFVKEPVARSVSPPFSDISDEEYHNNRRRLEPIKIEVSDISSDSDTPDDHQDRPQGSRNRRESLNSICTYIDISDDDEEEEEKEEEKKEDNPVHRLSVLEKLKNDTTNSLQSFGKDNLSLKKTNVSVLPLSRSDILKKTLTDVCTYSDISEDENSEKKEPKTLDMYSKNMQQILETMYNSKVRTGTSLTYACDNSQKLLQKKSTGLHKDVFNEINKGVKYASLSNVSRIKTDTGNSDSAGLPNRDGEACAGRTNRKSPLPLHVVDVDAQESDWSESSSDDEESGRLVIDERPDSDVSPLRCKNSPKTEQNNRNGPLSDGQCCDNGVSPEQNKNVHSAVEGCGEENIQLSSKERCNNSVLSKSNDNGMRIGEGSPYYLKECYVSLRRIDDFSRTSISEDDWSSDEDTNDGPSSDDDLVLLSPVSPDWKRNDGHLSNSEVEVDSAIISPTSQMKRYLGVSSAEKIDLANDSHVCLEKNSAISTSVSHGNDIDAEQHSVVTDLANDSHVCTEKENSEISTSVSHDKGNDAQHSVVRDLAKDFSVCTEKNSATSTSVSHDEDSDSQPHPVVEISQGNHVWKGYCDALDNSDLKSMQLNFVTLGSDGTWSPEVPPGDSRGNSSRSLLDIKSKLGFDDSELEKTMITAENVKPNHVFSISISPKRVRESKTSKPEPKNTILASCVQKLRERLGGAFKGIKIEKSRTPSPDVGVLEESSSSSDEDMDQPEDVLKDSGLVVGPSHGTNICESVGSPTAPQPNDQSIETVGASEKELRNDSFEEPLSVPTEEKNSDASRTSRTNSPTSNNCEIQETSSNNGVDTSVSIVPNSVPASQVSMDTSGAEHRDISIVKPSSGLTSNEIIQHTSCAESRDIGEDHVSRSSDKGPGPGPSSQSEQHLSSSELNKVTSSVIVPSSVTCPQENTGAKDSRSDCAPQGSKPTDKDMISETADCDTDKLAPESTSSSCIISEYLKTDGEAKLVDPKDGPITIEQFVDFQSSEDTSKKIVIPMLAPDKSKKTDNAGNFKYVWVKFTEGRWIVNKSVDAETEARQTGKGSRKARTLASSLPRLLGEGSSTDTASESNNLGEKLTKKRSKKHQRKRLVDGSGEPTPAPALGRQSPIPTIRLIRNKNNPLKIKMSWRKLGKSGLKKKSQKSTPHNDETIKRKKKQKEPGSLEGASGEKPKKSRGRKKKSETGAVQRMKHWKLQSGKNNGKTLLDEAPCVCKQKGCGRRFKTQLLLKIHVEFRHSMSWEDYRCSGQESEVSDEQPTCTYLECGRKFQSRDLLKSHVQMVHTVTWNDYCKYYHRVVKKSPLKSKKKIPKAATVSNVPENVSSQTQPSENNKGPKRGNVDYRQMWALNGSQRQGFAGRAQTPKTVGKPRTGGSLSPWKNLQQRYVQEGNSEKHVGTTSSAQRGASQGKGAKVFSTSLFCPGSLFRTTPDGLIISPTTRPAPLVHGLPTRGPEGSSIPISDNIQHGKAWGALETAHLYRQPTLVPDMGTRGPSRPNMPILPRPSSTNAHPVFMGNSGCMNFQDFATRGPSQMHVPMVRYPYEVQQFANRGPSMLNVPLELSSNAVQASTPRGPGGPRVMNAPSDRSSEAVQGLATRGPGGPSMLNVPSDRSSNAVQASATRGPGGPNVVNVPSDRSSDAFQVPATRGTEGLTMANMALERTSNSVQGLATRGTGGPNLVNVPLDRSSEAVQGLATRGPRIPTTHILNVPRSSSDKTCEQLAYNQTVTNAPNIQGVVLSLSTRGPVLEKTTANPAKRRTLSASSGTIRRTEAYPVSADSMSQTQAERREHGLNTVSNQMGTSQNVGEPPQVGNAVSKGIHSPSTSGCTENTAAILRSYLQGKTAGEIDSHVNNTDSRAHVRSNSAPSHAGGDYQSSSMLVFPRPASAPRDGEGDARPRSAPSNEKGCSPTASVPYNGGGDPSSTSAPSNRQGVLIQANTGENVNTSGTSSMETVSTTVSSRETVKTTAINDDTVTSPSSVLNNTVQNAKSSIAPSKEAAAINTPTEVVPSSVPSTSSNTTAVSQASTVLIDTSPSRPKVRMTLANIQLNSLLLLPFYLLKDFPAIINESQCVMINLNFVRALCGSKTPNIWVITPESTTILQNLMSGTVAQKQDLQLCVAIPSLRFKQKLPGEEITIKEKLETKFGATHLKKKTLAIIGSNGNMYKALEQVHIISKAKLRTIARKFRLQRLMMLFQVISSHTYPGIRRHIYDTLLGVDAVNRPSTEESETPRVAETTDRTVRLAGDGDYSTGPKRVADLPQPVRTQAAEQNGGVLNITIQNGSSCSSTQHQANGQLSHMGQSDDGTSEPHLLNSNNQQQQSGWHESSVREGHLRALLNQQAGSQADSGQHGQPSHMNQYSASEPHPMNQGHSQVANGQNNHPMSAQGDRAVTQQHPMNQGHPQVDSGQQNHSVAQGNTPAEHNPMNHSTHQHLVPNHHMGANGLNAPPLGGQQVASVSTLTYSGTYQSQDGQSVTYNQWCQITQGQGSSNSKDGAQNPGLPGAPATAPTNGQHPQNVNPVGPHPQFPISPPGGQHGGVYDNRYPNHGAVMSGYPHVPVRPQTSSTSHDGRDNNIRHGPSRLSQLLSPNFTAGPGPRMPGNHPTSSAGPVQPLTASTSLAGYRPSHPSQLVSRTQSGTQSSQRPRQFPVTSSGQAGPGQFGGISAHQLSQFNIRPQSVIGESIRGSHNQYRPGFSHPPGVQNSHGMAQHGTRPNHPLLSHTGYSNQAQQHTWTTTGNNRLPHQTNQGPSAYQNSTSYQPGSAQGIGMSDHMNTVNDQNFQTGGGVPNYGGNSRNNAYLRQRNQQRYMNSLRPQQGYPGGATYNSSASQARTGQHHPNWSAGGAGWNPPPYWSHGHHVVQQSGQQSGPQSSDAQHGTNWLEDVLLNPRTNPQFLQLQQQQQQQNMQYYQQQQQQYHQQQPQQYEDQHQQQYCQQQQNQQQQNQQQQNQPQPQMHENEHQHQHQWHQDAPGGASHPQSQSNSGVENQALDLSARVSNSSGMTGFEVFNITGNTQRNVMKLPVQTLPNPTSVSQVDTENRGTDEPNPRPAQATTTSLTRDCNSRSSSTSSAALGGSDSESRTGPLAMQTQGLGEDPSMCMVKREQDVSASSCQLNQPLDDFNEPLDLKIQFSRDQVETVRILRTSTEDAGSPQTSQDESEVEAAIPVSASPEISQTLQSQDVQGTSASEIDSGIPTRSATALPSCQDIHSTREMEIESGIQTCSKTTSLEPSTSQDIQSEICLGIPNSAVTESLESSVNQNVQENSESRTISQGPPRSQNVQETSDSDSVVAVPNGSVTSSFGSTTSENTQKTGESVTELEVPNGSVIDILVSPTSKNSQGCEPETDPLVPNDSETNHHGSSTSENTQGSNESETMLVEPYGSETNSHSQPIDGATITPPSPAGPKLVQSDKDSYSSMQNRNSVTQKSGLEDSKKNKSAWNPKRTKKNISEDPDANIFLRLLEDIFQVSSSNQSPQRCVNPDFPESRDVESALNDYAGILDGQLENSPSAEIDGGPQNSSMTEDSLESLWTGDSSLALDGKADPEFSDGDDMKVRLDRELKGLGGDLEWLGEPLLILDSDDEEDDQSTSHVPKKCNSQELSLISHDNEETVPPGGKNEQLLMKQLAENQGTTPSSRKHEKRKSQELSLNSCDGEETVPPGGKNVQLHTKQLAENPGTTPSGHKHKKHKSQELLISHGEGESVPPGGTNVQPQSMQSVEKPVSMVLTTEITNEHSVSAGGARSRTREDFGRKGSSHDSNSNDRREKRRVKRGVKRGAPEDQPVRMESGLTLAEQKLEMRVWIQTKLAHQFSTRLTVMNLKRKYRKINACQAKLRKLMNDF